MKILFENFTLVFNFTPQKGILGKIMSTEGFRKTNSKLSDCVNCFTFHSFAQFRFLSWHLVAINFCPQSSWQRSRRRPLQLIDRRHLGCEASGCHLRKGTKERKRWGQLMFQFSFASSVLHVVCILEEYWVIVLAENDSCKRQNLHGIKEEDVELFGNIVC